MIEEEELSSNKAESFPFYFSSAGRTSVNIAELQPTRANANLLFDLYFKNIHPFVMMLHKPRFFYDLSQFRRGSLNHSTVFEGLLFSVYYIAIMSVSDEYVITTFSGESKTTLLSRYQMATEMALKRSAFMQSHDLMSLQTLLLYLVRSLSPILQAFGVLSGLVDPSNDANFFSNVFSNKMSTLRQALYLVWLFVLHEELAFIGTEHISISRRGP